MNDSDRPMANPTIVLREEFDDWAVLFDPDTGDAFGLNPVSVFIWKRLDGNRTLTEILDDVKNECDDVADNAEDQILQFVDQLVAKGLAGFQFQKRY
jgi:SynChlorMet cassette protein ScmD